MNKILLTTALIISNTLAIAETPIEIPDISEFESKVADLAKCYMAQKQSCGGVNVDELYWSGNPSNDYASLTNTSATAPIPTNTNLYSAPYNYDNSNTTQSSTSVLTDETSQTSSENTDDFVIA